MFLDLTKRACCQALCVCPDAAQGWWQMQPARRRRAVARAALSSVMRPRPRRMMAGAANQGMRCDVLDWMRPTHKARWLLCLDGALGLRLARFEGLLEPDVARLAVALAWLVSGHNGDGLQLRLPRLGQVQCTHRRCTHRSTRSRDRGFISKQELSSGCSAGAALPAVDARVLDTCTGMMASFSRSLSSVCGSCQRWMDTRASSRALRRCASTWAGSTSSSSCSTSSNSSSMMSISSAALMAL